LYMVVLYMAPRLNKTKPAGATSFKYEFYMRLKTQPGSEATTAWPV
jgi:hypothetical protein